MKIVVAPDSFKGSLTSLQAANAIEKGIQRAAARFHKSVEIIKIPMADGGEGTVEAIITATEGRIIDTPVLDPLGRKVESFFGILPDNTGVIEMAAASGLNLIKSEEKNPLKTTTFGTGQLIKAALDYGCAKIIMGIGGSATNDGGVGMAQALGVQFLDQNGHEIGFGGGALADICKIDISGLDPRLKQLPITVACDVKNLLCGSEGASAVYGPQKGADPAMVKILDKNLHHLAEIIKTDLGIDVANIPGSGAAGGVGAGLIAFLKAAIEPGVKLIPKIVKFEERIKNAAFIITGEGATDYQTMFGKVPFGIAAIAEKYGKPVICVSGSLGNGYEKLYEKGITALFSIVNRPMPLKDAIINGADLLEKVAENIFNTIFITRSQCE